MGACAGPLSALDPAGPAAEGIAAAWWVMLVGGTVILLGVMALVLFAFVKRRSGHGVASGPFLWGGGLAFPIVVLAALLVYALPAGQALLATGGDGVPRIEVEAAQWHWTARYPQGGASTGVVHIPAGVPVEIAVGSADVIHSFWVPRLGGKIDAIPGRTNLLRIEADRPGVYEGVCAEFCGTGHAAMRFRVEAHAQEDYAGVLAGLGEDGE